MAEKDTKLPVIFEANDEATDEEYTRRSDKTESRSIDFYTGDIQTRNNKKSIFVQTFAVLLSLLALFCFFLCVFSESSQLLDTDKIISYIATDFLGIDVDSDKNIYEIFMSGSFGAAGSDNKEQNNSVNDDSSASEETREPSRDDQSISPAPETDNSQSSQSPPSLQPEVSIPEGEFPIIPTDLSKAEITVSNQTKYSIDINKYLSADNLQDAFKFEINTNMTVDPLVLIVHTHGTEAYTDEGRISYSEANDSARSTDITENVVAVGAEMAKVLNENGIPTIHCTIMHDKDSYKNSYQRAAQTVEEYLKKYPSIRYVFDVHRDSIVGESKTKYKPVTTIDGTPTAQIMFVVGSDESSPEHKNWETNLTFALKLTEQINSDYEKMVRPLSLRTSDYNQQYTKGSILIEVGACANTLEEAKSAARITALSISKIIRSGW